MLLVKWQKKSLKDAVLATKMKIQERVKKTSNYIQKHRRKKGTFKPRAHESKMEFRSD